MLRAENKKRDQEPPDDTYDDVWIKVQDEDGQIVERKVDKVRSHFRSHFLLARSISANFIMK